MSPAAVGRVAVEDVDREIARGFRHLKFSAPIEQLFLAEYLNNRARMVPIFALLGTIMYVAAILGDLSMLADMSDIIVRLRLAVFVPFAVFVVVIMRLRPTANTYDLLSFGVGVIGIALPMVTLIFSRSDHLFVYQTGSVGTLAFFVIVLRPRFRTVIAGLAAMLAIQIGTTYLNGTFDDVRFTGIVSFHVTLGVFLALSAYFAEHVDRQNFVNRLRSDALQSKLRTLSETDALTGLANRRVLDRLRSVIWSPHSDGVVSAMLLDIDSFKLFNDIYGHLEGDTCIRRISHIVSTLVGDEGTVVRYGGEEILVLLPGVSLARSRDLANRIREAIERLAIPHSGSPHGVVTASVGMSSAYTSTHSVERLLSLADVALYDAKRAGRNAVRERVAEVA
jgi:diguanylate cyclase (GGDEF)-like protein